MTSCRLSRVFAALLGAAFVLAAGEAQAIKARCSAGLAGLPHLGPILPLLIFEINGTTITYYYLGHLYRKDLSKDPLQRWELAAPAGTFLRFQKVDPLKYRWDYKVGQQNFHGFTSCEAQ